MQFSFIRKLSWFVDINGEEGDQNKQFITRLGSEFSPTETERLILNIIVFSLSMF